MIEATLQGGKQLEQKLMRLERKTGKKYVRKGVREGVRPCLVKAKSLARSKGLKASKPLHGGTESKTDIAKNIVIKKPKRVERGTYKLRVMMRPKVPGFVHITKDGERQYIPNAIEYGHAKPGGAIKEVAPIPFLRPSAYTELPKGEIIFKRVVTSLINGEWRSG